MEAEYCNEYDVKFNNLSSNLSRYIGTEGGSEKLQKDFDEKVISQEDFLEISSIINRNY